jgi:hypothetical protein
MNDVFLIALIVAAVVIFRGDPSIAESWRVQVAAQIQHKDCGK